MNEIGLIRLYALRAVYLFVALGIAVTIWPLLIAHEPGWPLMNGVVCSLLAAVSLLALLGIRYPLQMLPVLLFELLWKAIWLVAVALPLWRSDSLDAATMSTVRDCAPAAILLLVIPWRYVFAHYLRKPGERWAASASGPSRPGPER
ncbi:MAG TPA: hypothetical protein VF759_14705 [Allosphingosinicella sp.]|jgi:hypothetical protein